MILPKLISIILLSFILWVAVNQYFFCPRYSFKASTPFSGNNLYNPYDSMNTGNWVKCNFHAHTNAWKGVTKGHGTATDIKRAYDSMGYGVYCISDYQKIDRSLKDLPGFITAYEHGYGIEKIHQTVLGSETVCWMDYLFPQGLSNKQHIINILSDDSKNLVILNHLTIRDGYKPSEFKYLSNYDCMEVLNPSSISLAHWDSALSFGRPVFIVGSDDLHNVFSEGRLGTMCTWVNVSSPTKENVFRALRTGNSYGMIMKNIDEPLPVLERFEVNHDTISIEMSKTASQIEFSGQHGRVLATYKETSSAQYIFSAADHYVRAHIAYDNGTDIYLNPVFRYDKTHRTHMDVPVNPIKTFIMLFMGLNILAIWVWVVYLLLVNKQTRQWIGRFVYFVSEKIYSKLKQVFRRRQSLKT